MCEALFLYLQVMADDPNLWGNNDIATLEEVQAAQTALKNYDDILRTPLLSNWPVETTSGNIVNIGLKLESLQTTGSFKIRGMRYKLHQVQQKHRFAVALSLWPFQTDT